MVTKSINHYSLVTYDLSNFVAPHSCASKAKPILANLILGLSVTMQPVTTLGVGAENNVHFEK
jgi:hypothetical protein